MSQQQQQQQKPAARTLVCEEAGPKSPGFRSRRNSSSELLLFVILDDFTCRILQAVGQEAVTARIAAQESTLVVNVRDQFYTIFTDLSVTIWRFLPSILADDRSFGLCEYGRKGSQDVYQDFIRQIEVDGDPCVFWCVNWGMRVFA